MAELTFPPDRTSAPDTHAERAPPVVRVSAFLAIVLPLLGVAAAVLFVWG
jgi:hypothetical protein